MLSRMMVGVEYVDRFCVQIQYSRTYDLSLTSGVSLWFSIHPPRPSLKQPGTLMVLRPAAVILHGYQTCLLYHANCTGGV